MDRPPDRVELGRRFAAIHFEPLRLKQQGGGALRPIGAWQVTSDDSRVGGVSALALQGSEFIAVTDSGVVVRFPKPHRTTARALVGELPAGPGEPGFKFNRDSEALAKDPATSGWWIAFENRDQLWLYDSQFERVLKRRRLAGRGPRNQGIEAAAADGAGLVLIPEGGGEVVEIAVGSVRSVPIREPAGRISDAARLPSGELLVVNRRLTPFGFVNSLAMLERAGASYRYAQRFPLRLGLLDNVEAVAPEQLSNGSTRLWLMTDDTHQRPFRTLLIAVDLPRLQPRPRPSSRARA
jgi:hypothetical protein